MNQEEIIRIVIEEAGSENITIGKNSIQNSLLKSLFSTSNPLSYSAFFSTQVIELLNDITKLDLEVN